MKTMTHDDTRNGTTTLFDAVALADGKIISDGLSQHRHQEWIKFLKKINSETPPGLDLHLNIDDDATHKHPKELSWRKRPPRSHQRFTPTSSLWLNVIERRCCDLMHYRIRNGVFKSVPELQQAIRGLFCGVLRARSSWSNINVMRSRRLVSWRTPTGQASTKSS
jgi:hypothetical protein